MAEFLHRKWCFNYSGSWQIVYTIANSVGPITMITGGSFNDKFGPKKVILTGGLMVGIGMIASGFATSVGALIVTYDLIFRTWTWNDRRYSGQHMYEKFFPDKRGLIGGITTAIYGLDPLSCRQS